MPVWQLLLIYLLPLVVVWSVWTLVKRKNTRRARFVLEDNLQAGLGHPPSLHPIIDPSLCLGCGACVRACPEKSILGLIDGKAHLIEPTACVGHGACKTACPFDAISLVFGTEERGVEIPVVSPTFETNVPGIFIAGELGGMGLVKNAIEQGRQAIGFVAERAGQTTGGDGYHDTVIVGAGPAGISASLGAIERKLDFVTVEQSTIGGTVAHFPRGKMVMTAPATLPLIGEVKFAEIQKEELISFWRDVARKTDLQINREEEVLTVDSAPPGFRIRTSKGEYLTKTVLLAIGRRGTPRTLDVPGEEKSKVVYRLIDPEQYADSHVLVVGGGDSALEAATRIAEQPGTTVTLSYRGDAYARARKKNREAMRRMVDDGSITEILQSNVTAIADDRVTIQKGDERLEIANDHVIICAGGILPTGFLKEMGVDFDTKFGTA